MKNKGFKITLTISTLGLILISSFFIKKKIFDTNIKVEDISLNNSVHAYEVFTPNSPMELAKEGASLNKDVQIKNTALTNTLVRVDFDYSFENKSLDKNKIHLNTENVITIDDIKIVDESLHKDCLEKWVEVDIDNKVYYYYLGNIAPDGFSTKLLDSINLVDLSYSDNAYKQQKVDIVVNCFGTTSNEDGILSDSFLLNQNDHQKLIEALKIVSNSFPSLGKKIEGAKLIRS